MDTALQVYDADDLCGVSCIADGPDAWFAEAVLDHGGRLEVVVPAEEYRVGLVDRLIAVWDGQPARGYGGTADVVAYARSTGVPVEVVWPDGATRDQK
ncbi:hypothetical protein [Streptomyces sp. NPDC048644]|uniref:hypothetical protein n=1 Tax=Streptomyces sp. NPDC048644 TaxID=3365582 RepID=UPI0037157B00